jgi:putative phage-type endonuclease
MSVCEQREDWLLARTKGIGGSDAAAIVGLSPWKRPIDIFIGKTQAVQFSEDITEAMEWGNLLEPVIRAKYERVSGKSIVIGPAVAPLFPEGRVQMWDHQAIIRADKYAFMLGTPDGLMANDPSGLEIKNAGMKGFGWGPPGTDEIPDHYTIQCQWYMAVTGRPQWDVAVLFSGNRMETFRLHRNDELIEELTEAARAFWHDNVLRNDPPAIDDSESYGRYLARRFSLATGEIAPCTDEVRAWIDIFHEAEIERKTAEAKEQLAKNNLGSLLGTAVKTEGDFGSVNWIRPKQGKRTDWESVAKALNPPIDLIAEHTSPVNNQPYIRAYWRKEK